MNKKHVYSVAAQMLKRTVIVGGCKCIFAVIARSNFKAVAALINNFDYNPDMNRYTRNYYSEQEWMDMVYKELSEQRPIYYSGNDSKWENGHAFVINGYNAEGKVHVNWGWGGSQDGYFDIGILTPKNSGGYSYYQDMIVGIQTEKQGAWMSHLTLYYGMAASSPSRNSPNELSAGARRRFGT